MANEPHLKGLNVITDRSPSLKGINIQSIRTPAVKALNLQTDLIVVSGETIGWVIQSTTVIKSTSTLI